MEDLNKLSKKELIARLNTQAQPVYNAEDEIQAVDRMAAGTNPFNFTLKETQDHKGVYLYKELGDRIGPFHPYNAADIMRRWRAKGFNLYTRPRTPEQIEAYKRSPLYTKRINEFNKIREKRIKESNKRKPEYWAKEVARETALAVSQTGKPDADKPGTV